MKKISINFKPELAFLIMIAFTLAASAQKLPNIQKKSLRASNDINIDGKAIEWGNQFQAYNNATNDYL